MHIVRGLDEWLMSRIFEPSAWYCEFRWALGHAVLARFCYGFFWLLASAILDILTGQIGSVVVSLIGWYLVDRFIGRDIEREALVKTGHANPSRHSWVLRVSLSGMMMCLSAAAFIAMRAKLEFCFIFASGCIMSLYFSHCNPMPPWYKNEHEATDAERHLTRRRVV